MLIAYEQKLLLLTFYMKPYLSEWPKNLHESHHTVKVGYHWYEDIFPDILYKLKTWVSALGEKEVPALFDTGLQRLVVA